MRKVLRRHRAKEAELVAAEKHARDQRLNCWKYGEYDSDDEVKWVPQKQQGENKGKSGPP